MSLDLSDHNCIHPQCGACGQLFLPGDRLVALLRRNSSVQIYKAIIFTDMHQEVIVGGNPDIFCSRPYCFACRREAEESITVHNDCFQLFEQKCIVERDETGAEQRERQYRRLWVAGTRRYAWREMPPLKFPSSTTLEMPPTDIVSKICGFRKNFLPEVTRIIQSHSKKHILWRLCSVLHLVRELDSVETDETVVYPLPQVLSWSRGSLVQLVDDPNTAGHFIRLTIDSRGIKSIERISETPANNTAGEIPNPSFMFVVEAVEKLSGVTVEFELGMSRLRGSALSQVSVWSTPNPPHLASHAYGHLAAISLDPNYCTGISLFMIEQCVFEIHAHSPRHSVHLERFEYLNAMFQNEITWVYIPLGAQDAISAISIRDNVTMKNPHFFTLWTQTGKFTVGTPRRSARPGKLITYERDQDGRRPLNLVYSFPTSGLMSFITTDAENKTVTTEVQPDRESFSDMLVSSASLEGILNVHVFSDKQRNLCKGILIEYEDGSKRALGQCRLGWDSVTSWRRPLSIFYVPVSYKGVEPDDFLTSARIHKGVRVAFDSESSHVAEDGTLEGHFHEMKGCLNFRFTFTDDELDIS